MPSKSEIERRKLLRRNAEKAGHAEENARAPMSAEQRNALFNYLDSALSAGCDHTLRFTRHFLRAKGLQETPVVDWLQDYGGYWDCEVLANVEDRWGNR
jgi:hypothetical protein